jgi:hypothetical protein
VFEALLNLMSRALEGLNSLPWGVHALVALGMVVGIALWLAGQRLLKPMLVTTAALLGAVVGGLVVPSTSWGASLSVWHGLGIGLVAGLMVGLLLYRSAMAVGFGVVLGAALPLIAASVLQFYPIESANTPTAFRNAEGAWKKVASLGQTAAQGAAVADGGNGISVPAGVRVLATSWLDDTDVTAALAQLEQPGAIEPESAGSKPDDIGNKIPANLRPAADRISEAWATATGEVRTQWEALPKPHQAVVGLAGVIGIAGGVVAGLIMPAWTASSVTALFGAAVWLPCLVWLSNAFSAPWRSQFDRSPAAWLVIWAVVALVGMVVQWTGVFKKKGKAKPAPAAPAAA